MGPKHPKTTVTNTAVFLRFKRPVQYFGDRGDREGLPKLRAFSGPVYNTSFFPSELLCAIFGSLRDLSFLGTIAQVCRYWCVLVYNTEFLWASLLLDLRRTGETISSREEVYRRSLVWLPNLYMELVERGYCIENGLEFQTFVQGDRGVGKSALTIQLSQNVFIAKPDPTTEETYRATRQFHGKQLRYKVLDTSNARPFTAMLDRDIRESQAYIVMYSVTSMNSFEETNELLGQIARVNDYYDYIAQYNKPIILVANKSDDHEQRSVTYESGLAMAKKWQVGFIEISAKTASNVETLFETIGELYLTFRCPLPRRKGYKL